MSPDAPTPTYDSHGNEVAEWAIRISYDASRDQIGVYWSQEAGPYHTAKREFKAYDVTDLEDVLSDVQKAVRILGARRLF